MRFTKIGMGVALGLGLLLPANAVTAPAVAGRAQSNGCTSWTSTTRPPDYIRVLRRKSGTVERVPFRSYVITVMGKEWPGYLPHAAVEAGAVAVKQFGWYHALGRAHVSRRGQCFDVTDGIADQLYKPRRAHVRGDHYRAVQATWNVRLTKGGRLFMTAYRAGSTAKCGRGSNGNRLYARGAANCARIGYDFRQILKRYYGPSVNVGGSGGGGNSSPASQRSQLDRPVDEPRDTSRDTSNDTSAETRNGYRRVDDRGTQQIWRGSWRRLRDANAENDRLTYSGSAGSSHTFRFTGRTLQLIGSRGPQRGLVDVYVNGSRIARIDLYSRESTGQDVFFARGWTTTAKRTVKLVVVGAPNRSRVQIDAIRVD